MGVKAPTPPPSKITEGRNSPAGAARGVTGKPPRPQTQRPSSVQPSPPPPPKK